MRNRSWKLSRGVRFRRFFDEAVVVQQDASEVLGLNRMGVLILEHIRDGRGEDDILEHLLEEFDVEPEELAADLAAFVGELLDHGVLERAPASTGRDRHELDAVD